jgi:ABC-2 type transport system ATP-binding protein
MIARSAPPEAPAIEVEGLRRSYGELEAVAGISFTVAHGEVFCLLGPNGAGKTTTVEILEGYRRRSGGEVRVLGIDPATGARELRERVGIVLQSCGVQEELSVAELLEMYGSYYTRRRSVDEVLTIAGLVEKAGERARKLSGGQRRRLDLALALVGDPDLIFLDEPTTGFDPQARRAAWAAIHQLRELGTTIFLTTHFMDEAQTLADRVAIMRGGELVALGSPLELGGRDVRAAEIRFSLPPGVTLGQLPILAGGEPVMADAGTVLVRTSAPVAAAHALTGWAIESGVALRGFSVSQPTLEDIYLELTGSSPQHAITEAPSPAREQAGV